MNRSHNFACNQEAGRTSLESCAPDAQRTSDSPPTAAELACEIDLRLCSMHRLAGMLSEIVDNTRQTSTVFDLSMFESRACAIATMRHMHFELQKITSIVAKHGAAAEALHQAEIKAAQDGLTRAADVGGTRGSDVRVAEVRYADVRYADVRYADVRAADVRAADVRVADVRAADVRAADVRAADVRAADVRAADMGALTASKPKHVEGLGPGAHNFKTHNLWSKIASSSSAAPMFSPPAREPAAVVTRRSVAVTGDITVEAIVIPESLSAAADIFGAITSGDLHYIPQWNHFAVRIGACVLHAGLGHIYRGAPPRANVAHDPPRCVKECRRAKCSGDGCQYYHDPEEFAGSTDVRNFMAESWFYTPASTPARYGARRIGSSSDIEMDLRAISVDDARKFLHQTAHDVLCSMILWQHVLRPAARQKRTNMSYSAAVFLPAPGAAGAKNRNY